MAGDKRKSSKGRGRKGGAAAVGVAGALSLATCICGACKASIHHPPRYRGAISKDIFY